MLPDFDFCSKEFSKYGLELTENAHKKLGIYCDFLIEYNNYINLTAITDPVDILYKHFIDSILMCKYADFSGNGDGVTNMDALEIQKKLLKLG